MGGGPGGIIAISGGIIPPLAILNIRLFNTPAMIYSLIK
jgi:hypothetical protein